MKKGLIRLVSKGLVKSIADFGPDYPVDSRPSDRYNHQACLISIKHICCQLIILIRN